MVNNKNSKKFFLSLDLSAWWAHVMVPPDASKIKVFNKGTPKGEINSISSGGNAPPIVSCRPMSSGL